MADKSSSESVKVWKQDIFTSSSKNGYISIPRFVQVGPFSIDSDTIINLQYT